MERQQGQPQEIRIPIVEYRYRIFVIAADSSTPVKTATAEEIQDYLTNMSLEGWALTPKEEHTVGSIAYMSILHFRPKQSNIAVPPKGLMVPAGAIR